jgi:phosphate-selective porin OprO/OprP
MDKAGAAMARKIAMIAGALCWGIVPDLIGKRGPSLCVAAASVVVLCATPASAQDAQIQKLEAKIEQIEAQHEAEIKALQAEIRQLRRPRPASVAAAPVVPGSQASPGSPGQAAPPPVGTPIPQLPPKVVMTYDRGYHFGFSDATGDNTIELFGRLQLDTGGYLTYRPASETLDQKGLADGIDLRRARIGVVGNFMTDWHYAFVYDFGNTSDGSNTNNALANANSSTSPTTSNSFLAGVENAFITYDGFYKHGQEYPVAIDLGVRDIPWTLDEATSNNDLMFLERSSSQVVATEFGGGDFRSALGARSNNDRYWFGGYLTGPNSGALHTAGASCNTGTVAVTAGTPCVTSAQMTGLGPQFAFLTRGSYQVVQTPNATLHLGFNYANLFAPRVLANESAIQLFDRPELRVDPTTFLNTGFIPASGGQVYGAEVAASLQNFFVQGEYYHYVIDSRAGVTAVPGNLQGGVAGPVLNFDGGYAEASYSFGGKRRYDPTRGAYTGVIPETPLAPGSPGWGALEVAGRYSIINLNNPNLTTAKLGPAYTAPGVFTGGTTTYGGGEQTSYGVGLNWYPNLNMKFMLDYEHVVIDNPQVYGGANYRGATIDWIAGRTQIIF